METHADSTEQRIQKRNQDATKYQQLLTRRSTHSQHEGLPISEEKEPIKDVSSFSRRRGSQRINSFNESRSPSYRGRLGPNRKRFSMHDVNKYKWRKDHKHVLIEEVRNIHGNKHDEMTVGSRSGDTVFISSRSAVSERNTPDRKHFLSKSPSKNWHHKLTSKNRQNTPEKLFNRAICDLVSRRQVALEWVSSSRRPGTVRPQVTSALAEQEDPLPETFLPSHKNQQKLASLNPKLFDANMSAHAITKCKSPIFPEQNICRHGRYDKNNMPSDLAPSTSPDRRSFCKLNKATEFDFAFEDEECWDTEEDLKIPLISIPHESTGVAVESGSTAKQVSSLRSNQHKTLLTSFSSRQDIEWPTVSTLGTNLQYDRNLQTKKMDPQKCPESLAVLEQKHDLNLREASGAQRGSIQKQGKIQQTMHIKRLNLRKASNDACELKASEQHAPKERELKLRCSRSIRRTPQLESSNRHEVKNNLKEIESSQSNLNKLTRDPAVCWKKFQTRKTLLDSSSELTITLIFNELSFLKRFQTTVKQFCVIVIENAVFAKFISWFYRELPGFIDAASIHRASNIHCPASLHTSSKTEQRSCQLKALNKSVEAVKDLWQTEIRHCAQKDIWSYQVILNLEDVSIPSKVPLSPPSSSATVNQCTSDEEESAESYLQSTMYDNTTFSEDGSISCGNSIYDSELDEILQEDDFFTGLADTSVKVHSNEQKLIKNQNKIEITSKSMIYTIYQYLLAGKTW